MKPMNDYNEVEVAVEREKLIAGGYVLKILEAKDVEAKEYFEIIYDIAEGKEKGRYSDEWGKEHPYAHRFWRSYKDTAKGMFKGFIKAVEESNGIQLASKVIDGTLTGADLNGKLVGAIINYEEYLNDRGELKTRPYIHATLSAQKVRSNDYRVPPIKEMSKEYKPANADGFAQVPGFTPVFNEQAPTDEDLPF